MEESTVAKMENNNTQTSPIQPNLPVTLDMLTLLGNLCYMSLILDLNFAIFYLVIVSNVQTWP